MNDQEKILYKAKFREFKVCVLIPTYNNERTLVKVIKDVQEYTDDIIVINDGSTDSTSAILAQFPKLCKLEYLPNRGKGMALQKGFRLALERGYEFAITIDSDGQHMADDLPLFIDKLVKDEDVLIVGARNMDQKGIPGKSTFGHKFSNFWFWVETGVKLPDTQSGFRLYPIKKLEKLHFVTHKFEFEIEVIVRAVWRGIDVISVPVKVFYAEGEDRVTHFRPVKDFTRVGILNTVLVLIAFLFIKPFRFLRDLKKSNREKFINKYIINNEESNLKITFAVMLGVFMGVMPIWGWQMAVAITIAHLIKLNKVIVAVAANISIPPMIPIVLYLSYVMGGYVYQDGTQSLEFSTDINFEFIYSDLLKYVIGSTILGTLLTATFGPLTFLMLHLFRPSARAV